MDVDHVKRQAALRASGKALEQLAQAERERAERLRARGAAAIGSTLVGSPIERAAATKRHRAWSEATVLAEQYAVGAEALDHERATLEVRAREQRDHDRDMQRHGAYGGGGGLD